MTDITFAILLFGILLPSIFPRQVQFYRKDYTYLEEFDAFYKIHWDVSESTWSNAFFTCDDEGAILFYPKFQGEWTLVKKLTNKTTEGPNVTDIFVGLHDELGDFITVDGDSTPNYMASDRNLQSEPHHDNCMTMNIDTVSFKVGSCLRTPDTALPFVCKKVDDESCPTVDRGYKYAKASKRCYKVNEKPLMWQEAMKTCFLEGGILAVIEDNTQAQDLRPMLSSARSSSYFVGVRQLNSRDDFYTVKGQKFSDMYRTSDHEDTYSSFDCGAIYNNNFTLVTKSLSCMARAPFVCEMYV